MDVDATQGPGAGVDLTQELLERVVAGGSLAPDANAAAQELAHGDCGELVAALARARTHLTRRRAELPPRPA